jgi:hypothetical protein
MPQTSHLFQPKRFIPVCLALLFTILPLFAGGNIVITGHDDDLHDSSSNSLAARAQIKAMVAFARKGSVNPALKIIIFDHASELAQAMQDIGIPECAGAATTDCYDQIDPDSGVPPASVFDITKYSAFGVASDQNCSGCDNTSKSSQNLAAAKSSIAAFVNAGGGIFAFTAGQAPNTNLHYYDFLPNTASAKGAPAKSLYTATAFGMDIGIPAVNGDPTHNIFSEPGTGGVDSAWQVVERFTGLDSSTSTNVTNVPVTLAIQGAAFCASGTAICQITCPTSTATVGVTYSSTLTSSGPLVPPISWTLNTPMPGLLLGNTTGVLSGTPTTAGTYNFNITAVDSSSPPFPITKSCQLVVSSGSSGGPSTPPLSIFGTCPVSPIDFGTPLSIPLVGSGGQGSYKWALTSSPSWLSLSVAPPGTNATLNGTPNVGGPFSFSVTLSDTGGTTPVKTFSCGPITVVIPVPQLQITSACPASPVAAGTSISQFLSASGGSGVYDWSVYIGSLPPGLQLSGGRIFGTPTSPGTYAFTISVNSADQFAQTSCQLVVTAPALQLTSGCPGNGTQGVAYGPFPLAASGGAGPSSYVFGYTGNLPDGVSIVGNTIAGLPTKSGVFNFTPQVTSGPQTATRGACSVTIAPKPLGIQGTCPSDTQAGGTVSAAFSGVDGTPPYSYNFSGPAWLTQSSGTVSGKSALTDVGPASFTVTVTDAARVTQAKTCSFTVTPPPPPQITSTCPVPTLRSGSTLTLPLTATSGTPPYVWSYDNGEPDLSITSDSTSLTGILNKQGPFNFTISLTDNAGVKAAPLTCSLTVGPPPPPPLTLTASASCPTDLLDFGSAFSRTFSAGGGTAPYSWAVTPSDLFTLSPAAGPSTSLSGTLTRSGTITLTVTLNDNAGLTQTYPCVLNVKPFVAPTPTVVLGVLPQDITQPVPLSLTVSPTVPFPITGTVTLTFTSKATHPSNPPGPATLSVVTPYTFTIPAGSSTFPLPNIQRGKEYGTIHIAVTNLTGAGQIVPPATQDIEVPKLAPVFTANDVQINSSGSGFTIVIAGSSSTRDMTGGTITFNAANGATVDGGTVDLGTLGIAKTFDDWYITVPRSMNLTDFKNLTIPVTIEGDKSAITSVTVTLTNSGGSTPVTKSL